VTLFVSLLGRLADREGRSHAAQELARALGAEDMLLFMRDAELGVLLPAPGFVQTLRRGADWRAFVERCLTEGSATGRLSALAGDGDIDAWGYRIQCDAVVVLVGGAPDLEKVQDLLPLFPLVSRIAVCERELTQSNGALIRSLDDAASARAAAEEANRTKSGFLAMMSHELRTPLNAIGGYAGLLVEEIVGPLVPAQREYIARIKRSQMHLLALINDVLNFSKSESGTISYHLEPLDIRSVLSGATALIEPMADARGVIYRYSVDDADVTVLGDRDKVVQVVLNLLTNAVKFTPAGGSVTLELSSDANTAVMKVKDSGAGIPEEKFASIFEPFVQLERSFVQDREGVGLGLSISRELARGMGGDIRVESVVGEGSTFTFSLLRVSAARSVVLVAASRGAQV
jgi:signal transduction histidine kinase